MYDLLWRPSILFPSDTMEMLLPIVEGTIENRNVPRMNYFSDAAYM